jgi:translation initiation factor IF-3
MNKNRNDSYSHNKRNNVIMNERITSKEVRVIDEDGTALGIISKHEALNLAKQKQLDLILTVENAIPPVCKIISLNKYNYEIKKREKENAKKARASQIQIKEVKFRPGIGQNDLNIKLKHAQEFIDKGSKVKLTVQMRGRENAKSSDVFNHFKEAFEVLENYKYDAPLKMAGNRIIGVVIKDG